MIEIKPVEHWDAVENLLKTPKKDNVFAMAAYDQDELLAAGAVALFDEHAELLEVVVPKQHEALNLAYGMGKSLLNFIDRRGIAHVVCSDDALEPLLRRLRFKKTDKVDEIGKYYSENEIYYLNLTNYFTNHC
ncbi:MAG: hypothetical protein E7409_07770 [Ruminococcaceae bacterium]|nr:hypothetical protein [Oscillospiraceae bacterium]